MPHNFYHTIVVASKITIGVSFSALLLGLCLAVGLALLHYRPACRYLAKGWGLLIRGLPEIFILFFCYYGVTILLTKTLGHYVQLSPFVSGVIALGLVFSAYGAEVLMAGYEAIPKEEIAASKSLGLSNVTLFIDILLPQTLRHALPGLMNLWLVLLKDSSIVSLIGLHDMMNAAHVAASESFQPFNYYLFAGGLYLALTAFSMLVGKWIEQRTAWGVSHA